MFSVAFLALCTLLLQQSLHKIEPRYTFRNDRSRLYFRSTTGCNRRACSRVRRRIALGDKLLQNIAERNTALKLRQCG